MPKTTKAEGSAKRYPLNMRTTKEVRERLEAAAAASGRSLAQEVEYRLLRSFDQDDEARTRVLVEKIHTLMTQLEERGYDVKLTVEEER